MSGARHHDLVDIRDGDNDGILDGLEDLNHNGIFGDLSESRANVADTDGDGLTDGRELLRLSGVFGSFSMNSFLVSSIPRRRTGMCKGKLPTDACGLQFYKNRIDRKLACLAMVSRLWRKKPNSDAEVCPSLPA